MRGVRRWLGALVRLALVALLVLGAIAGWAFGCRPSIETDEVIHQATTEMGRLPALELCWIENASLDDSTVSALVIRHPEGDVMVDAGNSTHFDEETEGFPATTRLWLRLVPGQLVPTQPIGEALRRIGVDPTGLRWVIPTHVHVDHVGGLVDLPDAPVLMAQEDIDLAAELADAWSLHVIPAHARALRDRAQPIPFEGEPYEIFRTSHDLFGDGSVVVVPMPGHTPGSVGVFVNVSPSNRILHVGDVVHDDEGYVEAVAKPPLMRPTDHDPVRADRMVARLHRLHQILPELHILPAHSRPAWERIFGDPGCTRP